MQSFDQIPIDSLRIMKCIHDHPGATRLEIMEQVQASHLTVSGAIKALESQKLIRRSGKIQGESGRPSISYAIAAGTGSFLGIQVNLNTARFVLMDSSTELLMEWDADCPFDELGAKVQEAYIDALKLVIDKSMTRIAEAGYPRPIALALSLPGMVDTTKGTWISGLQFRGVRNIPLQKELESYLELPIFIEDNARAMVLFEKLRGSAKGYGNVALLYLGVGMGTGIVVDGHLMRGFHGTAGEIGHIPHANNNYRCSCGNIGCFETVVSPYGIIRLFNDRLMEGASSTLQNRRIGDRYALDLECILESAKEGDHFTIRTLLEIGDYIGDACDILIKLFNPEILVITGAVSMFSEFVKKSVESTIALKIASEISQDFQVIFPVYKPYLEAWGAAILAQGEVLAREIRSRR